MRYRPADVAAMRAELVRWYDTDYARQVWALLGETSKWGGEKGFHLPPDAVQETLRAERERCQGTLFYVSAEMLALAVAAAQSLPSFDLTLEDLPTPTGLMVIDGSLGAVMRDGEPSDTQRVAVTWGPVFTGDEVQWQTPDFDSHLSLWMGVYSDMAGLPKPLPGMPRLGYDGEYLWPLGRSINESLSHVGLTELPADAALRGWPSVIKTIWTLMQQPIITNTRAEHNRTERKWMDRQGVEDPEVRVLLLRRAAGHTSASAGDGGREFHHQWIVRGHWRNQWYPSREVYRPVWIAPHIKGPEDAPMLGGEKVHAWVR